MGRWAEHVGEDEEGAAPIPAVLQVLRKREWEGQKITGWQGSGQDPAAQV